MRRINTQKKSFVIIIMGVVILFSFAGARLLRNYPTVIDRNYEEENYEESENSIQKKEEGSREELIKDLNIAVCPTFYYMGEKLEEEGFFVIRTESTCENLQLMEEGKAHFSISGRGLLENNPFFPSLTIGPGYVFLSNEPFVIRENKMNIVPFFTDISPEEIKKDFSDISDELTIEKVDNIEKYLEKGVVITSVINEKKGKLVHLLREDDSRVRLARVPRLYYLPSVSEEKVKIVKNIVKEDK